MARQLRILFKDAHYHVINRGQGKRDIFLDDKDYKNFLRILEESSLTYKTKITAYCLMGNHYHLLIHTPEGNLPDFMRQLNGVYTQVFNKRYKQDGSLFKGRYKAIVVEEGTYLLRLIRYIHKNPVKSGLSRKASDYLYSSHKAYLRLKETKYLKFKEILKEQFKGKRDVIKQYRDFMSKEDQEVYDYLNGKRIESLNSVIFGNKEYVDAIAKAYLTNERIFEEIPEGKKMFAEKIIKKIKEEVKKYFKIKEKDLFASTRGKENLARMMTIGLIRNHCTMSYKEIGAIFSLNYKSVAKHCERIKSRCQKDKKIEKVFMGLKRKCSQVET